MTITYPRALPSTEQFRHIAWRGRGVNAAATSPYTSTQQVYPFDGDFWEADVELVPMTRADAEAWVAWGLSLRGIYGTFLLGDPAAATPRGIGTGTPLVDGASQTGRSLVTNGWTASQTGILKAGDLLGLGTGLTTRMYKVLQDANSGAAPGAATFDIWPPLRESPANGAAITVNSVKGLFRLASNVTAWEASSPGLGDGSPLYTVRFSIREAI